MKRLLIMLCAALLCSCAASDYISIVTDEAVPTESTSSLCTADIPGGTETTDVPGSLPHTGGLSVTMLTDNVKRGSMAALSVIGVPGVTYSISVYYSQSPSSAKGLEDKTADQSGEVSWSWRIGSRTKQGKHRIVITGGGETLTLYFTVG